jgi:hypothetical protein
LKRTTGLSPGIHRTRGFIRRQRKQRRQEVNDISALSLGIVVMPQPINLPQQRLEPFVIGIGGGNDAAQRRLAQVWTSIDIRAVLCQSRIEQIGHRSLLPSKLAMPKLYSIIGEGAIAVRKLNCYLFRRMDK